MGCRGSRPFSSLDMGERFADVQALSMVGLDSR
jgi:hypothetical protein